MSSPIAQSRSPRAVALAALGGLVLMPAAAQACGGFFCNNSEPVTQASEQILFARDGAQIEMHVQIAYGGPPSEFGWLLPAPPDVVTEISSDDLFPRLAANFTPSFYLRTVYADGCEPPPPPDGGAWFDAASAPALDAGVDGPVGVDVLSREAVGPFDRAILRADDVEALFAWLDANDYQAPVGSEDRLAPYVGSSVFVALKLLPGAQSDDIKPLALRFSAPAPVIPIIPTAVAAEPDMGVVVYMLGRGRAVPTNYLHVQINEATITWENGGGNYVDAVSHAVDEAGGRAFVTDFAGPHEGQIGRFEIEVDLEALALVRDAERLFEFRNVLQSSDVRGFVFDAITPPEGATAEEVLQNPWNYDLREVAVDGAALAANIEQVALPAWRRLDGLFEAHPDLTRLFSTMSAEEMDVDPLFDLNRDLPQVPAVRWGERLIECRVGETGDGGLPDWNSAVITTADGTTYRLVDGQNPFAVRRQAGETMRGVDEIGAAVVERAFAAGPFETVADHRDEIAERYGSDDPIEQGAGGAGGWSGAGGAGGAGDGRDGGADSAGDGGEMSCACDAGSGGSAGLLLAALLLGLPLRRRAAGRAGRRAG